MLLFHSKAFGKWLVYFCDVKIQPHCFSVKLTVHNSNLFPIELLRFKEYLMLYYVEIALMVTNV